MVARSVERTALGAGLVRRAEPWRWGSLGQRCGGASGLDAWLLEVPGDWVGRVKRAETPAEWEALRRSVVRGVPSGAPAWQRRTARRLGRASSLRRRGRPKKAPAPQQSQA